MPTRRSEFIEENPCKKRSKSKLQIKSPEDDWTKITDLSSRRRVQNRLAQRNHRANIRKRQQEEEEEQISSSISSSTSNSSRQDSVEPISFQFEMKTLECADMVSGERYGHGSATHSVPYQYHKLPTPEHSPNLHFSKPETTAMATHDGGIRQRGTIIDNMVQDICGIESLGSLSAAEEYEDWNAQYWPEYKQDYLAMSPAAWQYPNDGCTDGNQDANRHETQNLPPIQGPRRTTLHLAAEQGHVSIVDMLIGIGLDINSQDEEGKTALHTAACAGHAEAARLLLSKGAAIEAKDGLGRSALHCAIEKGFEEVVLLLLQHGADAR